MKNPLIAVTGSLFLLLTVTGVSFAGSNMSIPVSCSIPVLPGVNAPLNSSGENAEPRAKISVNNVLPRASMAQAQKTETVTLERISERMVLAKGASVVKKTKTVYAR